MCVFVKSVKKMENKLSSRLTIDFSNAFRMQVLDVCVCVCVCVPAHNSSPIPLRVCVRACVCVRVCVGRSHRPLAGEIGPHCLKVVTAPVLAWVAPGCCQLSKLRSELKESTT